MDTEITYQVKVFSNNGVYVVGSWGTMAQAFSMYCYYLDEFYRENNIRVSLVSVCGKDEQELASSRSDR